MSQGVPFGPYLILKRLAAGGMAEVFLARRRSDERPGGEFVLKRMQPRLMHDPQVAQLFLAESRIASQLSHPFLAEVFDAGQIEDTFYFAMEYVQGATFSRLTAAAREKGSPVPWPLAARLFAQLCEVLEYAHELPVVHCDLTPQNLMVTWRGVPKVLDFGIARAAQRLPDAPSEGFMGKVLYAAPEQHRAGPVTPLTDIYGLGLCLYELLTGQNPFALFADQDAAIEAILHRPPPSLRAKRGDVPPRLAELVFQSLAKNPGDRPVSALVLRTQLESCLMDSRSVVGTPELARWMTLLFPDSDGRAKAPAAGAQSTPLKPGGAPADARSTQPIDPKAHDQLLELIWKRR